MSKVLVCNCVMQGGGGGSYYPYILLNEIQTMFSQLGLVFFVLKSLLGIARQWSHEKFAILSLKLQSHIRILMYRTWLFWDMLFKFFLVAYLKA